MRVKACSSALRNLVALYPAASSEGIRRSSPLAEEVLSRAEQDSSLWAFGHVAAPVGSDELAAGIERQSRYHHHITSNPYLIPPFDTGEAV